jgi:nitrate reductase delta subunit
MKILSIISRLLDYPTFELYQHGPAIVDLIAQDEVLDASSKTALLEFVNQRFGNELLDWQSDYDGLFERGRSLSLLLYEHIHGESRDRGQAMVELLKQYRAAGLDIGVKELPDYIPLFLEFVSTQGEENARGWLQDVAPVIALLAVRLEERKCNYAALFTSLMALSQVSVDLNELRTQVKLEKPDNSKEALDKVWEEEAVVFGGDAVNGGCPTATTKPSEGQRRDQDVPIHFVDAGHSAATSAHKGETI